MSYEYVWAVYGLTDHSIKYKEKIWSLYKKDQQLFSTANPADFGPFIKTYKLLSNESGVSNAKIYWLRVLTY